MKTAVITLKEYQAFQRAYDFFNRELFAGSLPQVLVTLQRHANTAFPVHRRNFVRQSDIAFVNKQLENTRKNRSFGENP